MKLLLLGISLLLIPSFAHGQNNNCSTPAGNGTIASPKELYFIQNDFNTNDPLGQPLVSGFILQVIQGTTIVSTANIAKTAATLQPGAPANCYKITLPTFSSAVQPNQLYKIGLIADNPTIPSTVGVSTQSFFLQGAPSAPGNLKLAIVDWLSKLYQAVLSTQYTKNWFKPIGL